MADLVYLNLWLNNFSESTMLQHWGSALAEFPVSATSPGVRSLAVYPFRWSETPILEQSFQEGADVDHVVGLTGEWLHADCAYQAQMNWDLWLQASSEAIAGKRQVPAPVSVVCFGQEFEDQGEEGRCDLQVNFGLDFAFVPEQDELTGTKAGPEMPSAMELVKRRTQENIQLLLSFVRRLERKLPVAKKLLWSESEENLAEKILSGWEQKT